MLKNAAVFPLAVAALATFGLTGRAEVVLKQPVPDKLVVLNFDDAVSNHATIVPPLLKKYGFGATFYVCEFQGAGNDRFETDQRQYMTWAQMKSLHEAGFEIGNHTLHHAGMRGISREKMLEEISGLEQRCKDNGIPVPTTFAYPGHATSGEAVQALIEKGYTLARNGGERAYLPTRDHPLLIPCLVVHGTDDKPFLNAVSQARSGRIPVLLFHGVPDYNHPWVDTQPADLERRLKYLYDNGYTVIATRDLTRYVDAAAALKSQAPNDKTVPRPAENAAASLLPFWQAPEMVREPLFFIKANGAATASAKLLFVPTQLSRLSSASGAITYEAGRDFVWKAGTSEITLTPDSRIPFKTFAEMYPPAGAPQSISQAVGGASNLFFSEGHVFHDLQAEITYRHEAKWNGAAPKADAGAALAATVAKLRTRQNLKIVVLGDSISAGGNASGFTGAAPAQPPYPQLVVEGLEAAYGAPAGSISMKNLSVGGKRADWGVTVAPNVVAEKPDLLILAFGMNDVSGRVAPADYAKSISAIMAAAKAANPAVQCILVSPMTGNAEWSHGAPAEKYLQLRDALSGLCGDGVALADVTSLWIDILKTKKFADLTGNGVNHPNDFGHRLYAQTVLQLLR